MTRGRVCCVGGLDPTGGAGLVADALACAALGAWPQAIATCLTVQDTAGVRAVQPVPVDEFRATLRAALDDIGADVVKVGALGSARNAAVLAEELRARALPLVFDPVIRPTSGVSLFDGRMEDASALLLPLCTLVTPNAPEAAAMTALPVATVADTERAARALVRAGAAAALVKGGHQEGPPVDVLWDGVQLRHYRGVRVEHRATHGTGCVLASAVAAGLASGRGLADAVAGAHVLVQRALRRPGELGRGRGPVLAGLVQSQRLLRTTAARGA